MQDYPRRTQLQLVSGLGFGLSLVFFALQSDLILALAGLTVLGFTATFFQALNATMVMSASDPRYYGRVMSVNMMTFALMPLGTVPIGFIADMIGSVDIASLTLLGVQAAQVGAGVIVTVFILIVTVKNPAYRRLEQDDFKRFAVVAAERIDDKAEGGSSWQQLRRAMQHERGSQMASKLSEREPSSVD
jgi:MFS family permease